MAYSRNWDDTAPAGSSQVSAGDNAIRAMKEDLEERIESVFEDIDADPLVFKTGALPGLSAGVLIIPPTALQPHKDDDDVEMNREHFRSDNNADFPATCGFFLPAGLRITLFEAVIDKFSASSVDADLGSVDFATGVATTGLVSLTRSSAGIGKETSGALNILTSDDTWFTIEVNASGGGFFRVYGFRITYEPV